MATNSPGDGKRHISTSVDDVVYNCIVKRATALEISKGNYLRKLITDWYNNGSPAVSEADKAIQIIKSQKINNADKE